jgi:alpha-amylase
MDYETFGEHQSADTGIFEFLRYLPARVLDKAENEFLTPSQAADKFKAAAELDVPNAVSWSESERDLSAWIGNAMQSNALHELYKLEGPLKEKGEESLLNDWRRLTSSDHFYYMSTKHWAENDLQKHFSPYESPYDSYINYMNVLDNIQSRLRA